MAGAAALPQAKAIVRALARLHAAWWDDARLGQSVGSFATRDETAADDEVFAGHYQRFADDLGDRLGAERRGVYDRFIAAMPRLRERYHSRRNVSLTHGDGHIWNFLVPKAADSDDVRPFDFDLWHINVPASDLAYMIATHLYPERRREIETPLLDCYHDTRRAMASPAMIAPRLRMIIGRRCCGTSASRCGSGPSRFRR